MAIPDFPIRKDLHGIGMSDWNGYADRLAVKLDFQTTFFHQEPFLDICDVDPAHFGRYDFIICSEVLEHIAPPVSRAFENLRRLLVPSGFVILTVPYAIGSGVRTVEHFPRLHRYQLEESAPGHFLLRNRTLSGEEEIFTDLRFHGGTGFALEMRLFSREDLVAHLSEAGFSDIRIVQTPDLEHGVHWDEPWSRPIVACAR